MLDSLEKEIPTQVISCEICKIFKNYFFEKYLQTATYVVPLSWLRVGMVSGELRFMTSYLES